MLLKLTGVATGVLLAAALTAGAADKPDPKAVQFFEAKIRPILAQSCVGCHGAEKQKGDLRLDTREGLLAGGKDGNKTIAVYDAANPENSLILKAISYKDEDAAMPPPKKNKATGKVEPQKLSQDKIDALTQWIKTGAIYGPAPVVAVKKH